jgi:autotransporter-associated beta strand protein
LAQTGIVWNGSSNNNWSNVNSWTGGAIPTAAQVAIFDSTGAGHTGVNLNNSYTVAGLKFDTSAPSYTIAGANTLTLAGTLPYIQQKSGNNQTLSFTTLALGNNTVADITGAGNLTISSAITGAYSLTRDGSGTGKLVLNGANTFSGGLFINSGVVQAGNTGALGTGTTTISGGAALELSGGISPTNALSVGGQGVGGAGAIRNVAGNNTLSGTVTLAEPAPSTSLVRSALAEAASPRMAPARSPSPARIPILARRTSPPARLRSAPATFLRIRPRSPSPRAPTSI